MARQSDLRLADRMGLGLISKRTHLGRDKGRKGPAGNVTHLDDYPIQVSPIEHPQHCDLLISPSHTATYLY
jgi:hypothetical protein